MAKISAQKEICISSFEIIKITHHLNSHTKHNGLLRREIPIHLAISTLLSVTDGKCRQKTSNVIEDLDSINHFTLIEIREHCNLQLLTIFSNVYETFPTTDHMLSIF